MCGSICTTPVGVSGLSGGVAAISAGFRHTCAVTTTGAAKCWGNNNLAQLGNGGGFGGSDQNTPVDVAGLGSGVAAIDAGVDHTCVLISAADVKCWGLNAAGALGDGQASGLGSGFAVDVSAPPGSFGAVSAGGQHTCAVATTGGVECWGRNELGQLGVGTSTGPQLCVVVYPCSTTPVGVSGLGSGIAAVSSGGGHTCALTIAGGVKCWGWNAYGQLGDGTHTGPEFCSGFGTDAACSTTPVDVSSFGPKPATATPTRTPGPSLGGVAAYPDVFSGGDAGLLARVFATAAVVLMLAGAGWYRSATRKEERHGRD